MVSKMHFYSMLIVHAFVTMTALWTDQLSMAIRFGLVSVLSLVVLVGVLVASLGDKIQKIHEEIEKWSEEDEEKVKDRLRNLGYLE